MHLAGSHIPEFHRVNQGKEGLVSSCTNSSLNVPETENWQNPWNFPRHRSDSNFIIYSQTHIVNHLTAMEIFPKQWYF